MADHRRRDLRPGGDAFGSTLNRTIPYFPDLLLPIVVGGFWIGIISVVLPLCALANIGPREIGPISAIILMVQNLGGPLVLVIVAAVQTSRTLYLGGTTGPVADMTPPNSGCAGRRVHLFAVVDRRGGRPGRRHRSVHRLFGQADRRRPAHPGSGRGRGTLSGTEHRGVDPRESVVVADRL